MTAPRTKKNSQQIYHKKVKGKKIPFIVPSKAYQQYEIDAGWFIRPPEKPIDYKVNVKAYYYMDTKRKVDITNLNGALHDILVKYGVLKDDDSKIVVSTDGSRVRYDKDKPRTEVFIDKATR